ncbi:unnamed protein product [Gadus morhua 'NCC']
MDQQENENTALSQVAAGIALSLLAAFVATVWWFDRQRRTSESPTRPRMEGDRSVFKVPQSPPPKTPKPSVFEPISEPEVQEAVGQFEDTEEAEENMVS